MVSFVINYIEHFTYIGIFLLITLGSLGVPVPEEFPLIVGGVLLYKGYVNPYLLIGVGVLSILISDSIIFCIGKKWGRKALNHRGLKKIFTLKRLERGEDYFKKHGEKAIFIGRFISGIRVISLLSAGIFRMRLLRFLTLDFMSALISVPLFIGLGYISAPYIEVFLTIFYKLDRIIGLLSILILISFFYHLYRRENRFGFPGKKRG